MLKYPIPANVPTIQIYFQGECISVDKYAFIRHSNKLLNYPEIANLNSYTVESNVSKESFEQFILACTDNGIIITESNYPDLLKLCKEFDSQSILNAINEFIMEDPLRQIFLQKESQIENDLKNDQNRYNPHVNQTKEISKKLSEFLNREEFYKLDIETIHEIFKYEEREKCEKEILTFIQNRIYYYYQQHSQRNLQNIGNQNYTDTNDDKSLTQNESQNIDTDNHFDNNQYQNDNNQHQYDNNQHQYDNNQYSNDNNQYSNYNENVNIYSDQVYNQSQHSQSIWSQLTNNNDSQTIKIMLENEDIRSILGLLSHLDFKSLTSDSEALYMALEMFQNLHQDPSLFAIQIDSFRIVPLLFDLIQNVKTLQTDFINTKKSWEIKMQSTQNMISEFEDKAKNFEDVKKQLEIKNEEIQRDLKKLNEAYRKITEDKLPIIQNLEKEKKEMSKLIDSYDYQIKCALAVKNPFDGIISNFQKTTNYSGRLRNDNNGENEGENIENFVKIVLPIKPYLNEENYDNQNGEFSPYNLFKYENQNVIDKSCYYHNLQKNQADEDNWLIFDFNKNKIKLVAYSIRTNCFGESFSHPKSFKILGSNDGQKWTPIDSVSNAKELDGSMKCHTFICKENYDKYFQQIKYLQLDTHHPFTDRFGIIAINAFEFFGDLTKNE
ncbi:hypothetical protein TRFO_15890 [Tritrichomonas foetus]|uniref:F5/8 type C domain-containing protein n=1 Tax=Tritrichomonas foetus TaxID=1144522 RepID=A0A1J4KWG2_9EUKA|nr:hypothetical protein TRFO_15890 [Tritrichomonas foetus]|eukprot:OHT13869.1 hypothetical protein TRFO_15890 [Tritrichomonas foetus]